MILRYINYDNIDINEELFKIENCNNVEIILEPKNKKCLFILGILFAKGVNLKILNKKELDFKTLPKSFPIMSYVWELLCNKNFPNKHFSNVNTNLEKTVENIKRLGFKIKPIINNVEENKIFLICPVRNADNETKKEIENYVKEKNNEGYNIHAPHLHTIQQDILGGYTICLQNANAIATSKRIDIYYDQNSTGSAFDLGVAYYLEKSIKVLNVEKIEFNDNDFIDSLIINWRYKIEEKVLSKNIGEKTII